MTTSAALTAGNLTALRAGNDTTGRYLAFVPKVQVATARINQATFSSPHAGFVVDNTSANWDDVTKGMTAWIGTTEGGREIGVYRVREDSDPTTLLLDHASLGDPGLLALSDLNQLPNDAYVTVWQDRNIWSIFPRIEYSGGVDARSGTFFKKFDDAYTNQNETVPDFALNIGPNRADTIDDSDIVTFVFALSVYPHIIASIVDITWDMGDGTVIAGDTDEQTLTVTFPAGYREISCTVTLDTGAVRTVYRSVWGGDPADSANHLPVQILSDRRSMLGRRIRLRAFDPMNALEDGQMGTYWEKPDWNGEDVDSASKQHTGWLRSISGTRDPDSSWREFELVSAMHVLSELDADSQQFVVTTSPANWQEVIAGLSHVDYWVFYLLNYHTSILDIFDYEVSTMNTYFAKAWQVGNGSWAAMLNQAGARINCSVGQHSDGTIFVRRNPQLMSQADRDAVIERMELTEVDVGDITINRVQRPRVGQVRGSAFAFDGSNVTPYLAVAPGNVSGQSASPNELPDQLIIAANGQAEINERTANEFARLNNPYESINVPLPLNYDVFEPCEQYWVRLNIPADYWPEGVAFNRRCLVRAVTVNHEEDTKNLVLELEAETSGINAPAQDVPVVLPSISDNAGFVAGNRFFPNYTFDAVTGMPTFAYDPWTPPQHVAPLEPLPEPAYLLSAASQVWITNQRGQASPAWTSELNPGPDWAIFGMAIAAGSTASNLRACVVAQNITTDQARIYYNDNVTGSGIWVLKQELEDVLIEDFHHVAGETDGWVAKNNDQSGNFADTILHTDDNWDSYNSIALGTTAGDPRFDVDDFGLGVVVVGRGVDTYYTTSYTDANAVALSGLSAASTGGQIQFVRIPFKKVLTQEDNDDPTALQFIIGVDQAVSGETTWAVTFNTVTGALVTEVDITPNAARGLDATYYARHGGAFQASGGNSQIMLMNAVEVGTSTPVHLILSEDGGGTWEVIWDESGGLAPRWLAGSSNIVMLSTSAAIYLSEDRGRTRLNQTGDLSDGNVNATIYIPG